MKLYYLQGACSLAVHIALEWVGADYTAQSMGRDELKQADFLALNPAGSAPVLSDAELVLTQSSAILYYVAEKYPQAGLLGKDLAQKANTLRWLNMVNADLHAHYRMLFGWRMYADAEQSACQERLKAGAIEQLNRYYRIIDAQLVGQDYLTGQRSVADSYLYVTLRWARALEIDLSAYTELTRFYHQLSQDSGVIKALVNEGLELL